MWLDKSYEGTAEARLHKGHEGTKGDLWGVENLFRYTKGGTVTDRVSPPAGTPLGNYSQMVDLHTGLPSNQCRRRSLAKAQHRPWKRTGFTRT